MFVDGPWANICQICNWASIVHVRRSFGHIYVIYRYIASPRNFGSFAKARHSFMCVWAAEASTQHILLCFAASAAFSPEISLCGVPVLYHRIMISITCYQIISLPLFNVVCKSPVTWEVSTEIQACTSTAVGSHKQILCQLVLDCNSKLGSLKW